MLGQNLKLFKKRILRYNVFKLRKEYFLWQLILKEILANGLLDLCHKKDLSQITVKDLLEATGVSRQTFYNHFLDKK